MNRRNRTVFHSELVNLLHRSWPVMALAYIDCENCKIHPVLVSSLQAAVSAESNLLLAHHELFCAQNLA